MWSRRAKAAAVAGLMVAAAMDASLLAPTQADASAFPGKNGKIVFASERTNGTGVDNPGGDDEIFTMNPDGTGLKQLTNNTAEDKQPSYSADGKKIVFRSDRTGNNEIFVMNADGTGQKNLTNNPVADSNPSFSPGGKAILFDSVRNANQDIFVMNADGTAQRRLTSDPDPDFDATFSPGGNKIAFVSFRDGGDPELYDMNADGTQQDPLTVNDDRDEGPTFSPDGNRIAFASNRDGGTNIDDFDVFVMSADGSTAPNRLTNSVATEDEPAFSPDGKKIAYTTNRDGGDEDIFVMDSVFGDDTQTNATSTSSAFDFTPDWQPLAGNFTVTSTSDPGDGVCDADCTLREALTASNEIPGSRVNTIGFDIPGTGVQTITPSSVLPAITRPVLVDGYTQPGASPNTLAKGTNAALKIELNGADVSPATNGLNIVASNSTVRGLVINRFSSSGVVINGSANHIVGNFIGTDASGTLDRGNPANGVTISSSNSGNTVGGPLRADRNLISGNDSGGVVVDAANNTVEGNLIGTKRDGLGALGNGESGVLVANNAAGVSILGNSIFSNGGLGIDLSPGFEGDGITANDGDNPNTPQVDPDGDSGPNNLQNFPVLSSAKKVSGTTTIAGKLNSTPAKTFIVQFFSNPKGTDEGKTFIGEKSVTTDGSGNASFTFSPKNTLTLGQTITATATGAGSTSEFSAPRTVTAS